MFDRHQIDVVRMNGIETALVCRVMMPTVIVIAMIMLPWVGRLLRYHHHCYHPHPHPLRVIIGGAWIIVLNMTCTHRMRTGVEVWIMWGQRHGWVAWMGPIEMIVQATHPVVAVVVVVVVAAAAAVADASLVDNLGTLPSFVPATYRPPATPTAVVTVAAIVAAAVAAAAAVVVVAVGVLAAAHPKHLIAVGFHVHFLERDVGVAMAIDARGYTRVTKRPIARLVCS